MLSKHQKLQGQLTNWRGSLGKCNIRIQQYFTVTGSGCWYFMFANYSVFELRWNLQQMNPLDEDSSMSGHSAVFDVWHHRKNLPHVSSNRNENNFLIYPIYTGNNDPCAESTETNQTKKKLLFGWFAFWTEKGCSSHVLSNWLAINESIPSLSEGHWAKWPLKLQSVQCTGKTWPFNCLRTAWGETI